ncbi:uncharacterized protein LOC118204334 [Stegodyphus dumicola]|uniref:uncharacterized protein LOC118204334 n=1 Tax=Stegodyphus dumicola TaxID=202533 RepID=UPI0015AD70AA|nr:uncharacterized protein LOC118204334 [Stegodyphus dumicola]
MLSEWRRSGLKRYALRRCGDFIFVGHLPAVIVILYTIILTGAAFHIDSVMDSPPMVAMSLLMLGCSGCCVVTSVLLLIGLCVDSRMLLIPWLISVFSTTAMDIIISIYLLIDAQFNTFLVSLFSIDFILCALNVSISFLIFTVYIFK